MCKLSLFLRVDNTQDHDFVLRHAELPRYSFPSLECTARGIVTIPQSAIDGGIAICGGKGDVAEGIGSWDHRSVWVGFLKGEWRKRFLFAGLTCRHEILDQISEFRSCA